MHTDITSLFKARGKTIAQKKLKEQGGEAVVSAKQSEEPSLSYRKHALGARKLANDIHEFGHVILARRREYLDFNALMATMSNSDRDRFDQDGERGLRNLSQLALELLEKITRDAALSQQEKDHLKAVCALLEKEIKKIGRVVTEMRRLRLTSMASRREMSRLSTMVAATERRKRLGTPDTETAFSAQGFPISEVRRRHQPNSSRDEAKPLLDNKRKENLIALADQQQEQTDPQLELSADEMNQLQKENDKLFKKFTSAQDTVNSLETQIFEIQRLQEAFSDKVFDQEKEIELINEMAVSTTESVKDANEFIRQAISNSASRRVVILFCIVVLTFTLLFLDWYNP